LKQAQTIGLSSLHMVLKKPTRSKERKKPKTAAVTTRSTAGPGFDFEDQIAAYLLLKMLAGESLPGLEDSVGSKLRTQTRALGWAIDDLLAISNPNVETQRQLAVSCKSSVQVSASRLPKDFILAAWEQWTQSSRGPMRRGNDKLMLVTRGRHQGFQGLWADVKNWCSGESKVAIARISATAAHRKIFASLKGPIQQLKAQVADAELVELITHLEVMATDFDLADSEDRRRAIVQCRGLLVNGTLAEARNLWEALVCRAHNARVGNGTVELPAVWRDLASEFALKDHPDYAASWAALQTLTANYKSNIETVLSTGLSISRSAEMSTIAELISREHAAVLFGESGGGKSALAKLTLDQLLPTWRQVWLGPDELTALLNQADRSNFGVAHPLEAVLRWSSVSQNVLVIDSAERLTPEVQKKVRGLVASLREETTNPTWSVLIVGRTEAWTDSNLQRMANATLPPHYEVKLVSAQAVRQALRSAPRLVWATSHEDIVTVLTNLRALAWVLEAEGRFQAEDAPILASYTAIADHLWRYWTNSELRLHNVVVRLAVREANFEHSFAVSE
jgi:hypothetical protein